MHLVLGSSSNLAKELASQLKEKTYFFGRSNPHSLPNFLEGLDLRNPANHEKIGVKFLTLIQATETDDNSIIFLNGLSTDNWEDAVNVNLLATAHISTRIAEYSLNNRKRLNLVFINSYSMFAGKKIPYATTKAALTGLMHSLNNKYPAAVRANQILPGAFEGGMTHDWSLEKKEKIAKNTLAGSIATERQIIAGIKFLLENDYVYNETLNLKGF